MYYVYILKSLNDNGIYIGFTSDLKKRFEQHQNGESLATKGRRPFSLIHYQAFTSKEDALSTEKYLKTTRGWERIHRMLVNSL